MFKSTFISIGLHVFLIIFEIVDNSGITKSVTAEFKVIGRDIFTDILVGKFDLH